MSDMGDMAKAISNFAGALSGLAHVVKDALPVFRKYVDRRCAFCHGAGKDPRGGKEQGIISSSPCPACGGKGW